MRKNNTRKVVVGMSGGVDSSVSAYLLQKQGYRVEGLFMKNWEEDDSTDYCSVTEDLADAQEVCDKLGIKLHTVNFATEYWDNVFQYLLAEYRAGRTPNPDVMCNKEIKFRVFLEFAREELSADCIATGHYARRSHCDGHWQLLRGADKSKDQSYFLYTLGEKHLAQTLFPVGELEKTEVRMIAKHERLVTADKKDSTGVCFIGARKFTEFLRRYLPAHPGAIETCSGEVIGEHQGLMYHTLGQRKGLHIGGRRNSIEAPWYVVDKDTTRNVLIVGQGQDHPSLRSRSMMVHQLHWVSGPISQKTFHCKVKTRYRQPDINCEVSLRSDDILSVCFDRYQIAVTPGQSAVFYEDNICLGGGVIDRRFSGILGES